jgi:Flp pilus assembly protein TadG
MTATFVPLLASARLLLIPLAILAFLLFLLILGTIALGIALGLISALSWIARAPRRYRAKRASRGTPR